MRTIALPPFWSLVEAHGDELLVHARRLTDDAHAEDVVQEALLRALRAYPRLRHADHLRAWLYRVTTTTAMDHHRRRAREVLTEDPPAAAAEPDHYDDAFEALIAPPPRHGAGRAAAALRRRPRLRRLAHALALARSRAPARLHRHPHPPRPGSPRMTLPSPCSTASPSAAVAEGLADAVYTRLPTPIGTLTSSRARAASSGSASSEEPVDALLAEVAAGLGPRIVASDRELAATRDAARGLLRGDGRVARPPRRPLARAHRLPPRRARGAAPRRAGQVVTYGELARRIDHPRAARAIGTACATNPVPIIVPCHRVLPGSGGVGNYGGGPEIKRRLLAHEGALPA